MSSSLYDLYLHSLSVFPLSLTHTISLFPFISLPQTITHSISNIFLILSVCLSILHLAHYIFLSLYLSPPKYNTLSIWFTSSVFPLFLSHNISFFVSISNPQTIAHSSFSFYPSLSHTLGNSFFLSFFLSIRTLSLIGSKVGTLTFLPQSIPLKLTLSFSLSLALCPSLYPNVKRDCLMLLVLGQAMIRAHILMVSKIEMCILNYRTNNCIRQTKI